MNSEVNVCRSIFWANEAHFSVKTMLRYAVLIVSGTLLLALASQVQIPFYPVPITLQTLAVMCIAMTYGSKLGVATVSTYVLLGACGLPFFAGFASGTKIIIGVTGGYILGFIIATWLMGTLMEKGWALSRKRVLATAILGNSVILLLGTAWLSFYLGLLPAIEYGLLPFIPVMLIKVGLLTWFAPKLWSSVN